MNNRAKDIFLEAIDLPLDQQDAFVENACASDDLLRREVLGMLATHRRAGAFLDTPAALDSTWLASQRVTKPQHEQAGDVIDRYKLVRVLGEGGFGTVFLAHQIEPVVRDVALKLIKLGMNSGQIVARFESERQALAMMDHPSIARVLDAGETKTGRPYFVMEYVDGLPITDFCRSKNLSLEDRLRLFQQVCLAVQHAHQKGIIHRDLKPSNILVTMIDGRPMPKVIDFGVAKATDPDTDLMPAVTQEMQLVGTPQYMSPEQTARGAKNIDTRSDIYSLGTILYEIISGAPPFDPNALRHVAIDQIFKIIREETPTRPSTRVIEVAQSSPQASTMSRKHLAREVDWIVMKALEKEPSRRYQTAAEFAEDIERHLKNEAVRAGPPSKAYQLRKFARRNRIEIAAASVVVVMLIMTSIVSAIMANKARKAELVARENQARAERELSRANAIVDFTDTLLEGIGPAVAVGRDTALLHDILDRAIENVGDKFKDQPGTELAVRSTIGQALYNLGDPKSAREQLLPIFQSTSDGSEKDSVERLRAGVQLAQMFHNEFDFENMIKILDEVMPGFERAGLMQTDSAREGLMMRCWALRATGRKNEAMELLEKLIAQLESEGRIKSPLALSARLELADIHVGIGRHDQACENLKQILEDQRETLGPLHPQIAETLSYLGESYQQQKKFDEAEKWLREGLELGRKIFPPGHSSLLATMTNYAALLIDQKRFDEADPLLTEAYETGKKNIPLISSPMPGIAQYTINLRLIQNRGPEAATVAMDLYNAFAEKYGARDRRTLSIYILLCKALPAAGRADEGIEMFNALGDLSQPQYNLPVEVQQSIHASAAHLYLAKDDIDGALRQHARARSLVQKDELQRERITGSLRDLEIKLESLNITTQPATAPTTQD